MNVMLLWTSVEGTICCACQEMCTQVLFAEGDWKTLRLGKFSVNIRAGKELLDTSDTV